MLKAIIVDIDDNYLIVANSRGDFMRIYNNYAGCRVGDEITVKNSKKAIFRSILSSMPGRKALAVAACFLLMIVTGYSVYGHVNPVTYITVDINPSIELSLNRYNLVLEARGLNDEGNNIVGDGREYRNMKLDKAFNMLLFRAMESNYLNMNTNTVMLTVSNVNDSISPNIEQQLQGIAETDLKIIEKENKDTPNPYSGFESLGVESLKATEGKNGDLVVIVQNTTYEKHKEAKKMDISQGKLVLYDKLKNIKPDVALNHVKESSVAQIIKEIEQSNLEKEKSLPKGKSNSNDKKQQMKDIKTLEKEIKNQLRHIEKHNKNLLKEEIKDAKDKLKNIKDIKKETDKNLKKESKSKKESIKDQRNAKNNNKQDENNGSDQGNKKPEVSNGKANNDKNKGRNDTKSKNNKNSKL